MRLNSPASSQMPPHWEHWSISTCFNSENHFRSSTRSGQRGHKRGSVSFTLLTGTFQIVWRGVGARGQQGGVSELMLADGDIPDRVEGGGGAGADALQFRGIKPDAPASAVTDV